MKTLFYVRCFVLLWCSAVHISSAGRKSSKSYTDKRHSIFGNYPSSHRLRLPANFGDSQKRPSEKWFSSKSDKSSEPIDYQDGDYSEWYDSESNEEPFYKEDPPQQYFLQTTNPWIPNRSQTKVQSVQGQNTKLVLEAFIKNWGKQLEQQGTDVGIWTNNVNHEALHKDDDRANSKVYPNEDFSRKFLGLGIDEAALYSTNLHEAHKFRAEYSGHHKFYHTEVCEAKKDFHFLKTATDQYGRRVEILPLPGNKTQYVYMFECVRPCSKCKGVQGNSVCKMRYTWLNMYHRVIGTIKEDWGYVAVPSHCACEIRPSNVVDPTCN